MEIEQLEKILENKIQRDLELWERDIKDYLGKKIREVNYSEGFNLDNIVKFVISEGVSEKAKNNYFKTRKEKLMKEIEDKIISLGWLFNEKP